MWLQMCSSESWQLNISFCKLFLFQFPPFLFCYPLTLCTSFSLVSQFLPSLPSLRCFYPSLFSDSFISSSLYASSCLSSKEGENTPPQSCWVILCRRETACWRSNNSHSLLSECTFCLAFSHHFFPPFSFTESSPFQHLLIWSFSIFSQLSQ